MHRLLVDVAGGLAGGVAGTSLMELGLRLGPHLPPAIQPPAVREDPGEFMVSRAEELIGRRLPAPLHQVAAQALHDAEAPTRDVPAHDALAARVEAAPARHHLGTAEGRPGLGKPRRPPLANRDHRRGAVSEQAARDEVGDGEVLLLQGQRAQLHRQQHGDVVGEGPQVVVEPRDPRGPSHAAQRRLLPRRRDLLWRNGWAGQLATPQPGRGN